MNLTPRLKCIADKVKRGSYPADIGTDHAYIPIYLIEKGICSRAVATEVRLGPLNRAEKNVRLYNMVDEIMLIKGSGLTPIHGIDVDCAILSGMGGYLICDILGSERKKAESIEYLILQPVQAPEAVREFLYKNNYIIINEQLVMEGNKIYQVIVAEHGVDIIDDEIYLDIGKRLIENKDPLLRVLIEKKMYEMKNVISKISGEDSLNARMRIEECRYKLKRYEEVLECL